MTGPGTLQRIEGPAGDIQPTHHLVVGFDRAESSMQALRFAITLAAAVNAHLHVAHIVDLEDFPIDPDGDDWQEHVVDALAQERARACDLLRASPVNWTYSALHGDPAGVLRVLADDHDALMIVVGSARGGVMSALDRALGESVSAHLLRHAHRPVVLVPVAGPGTKAVP
ncbi:MAG: universal stress protein [Mycobacterium sp.]|nr:universal stress protein [Mycobacterium sp.]